jgi:hypothetical protein
MLVSSRPRRLGGVNMIWRVALAGTVLAVLGGFFVGRVVADPTPLPSVKGPVEVGPSARPTPSGDPTTLRPRRERSAGDERTRPDVPVRTTTDDDRFDDADDNSGPGGGDDDSGRGRGRGRGRSGEGDGDVRTVGPSPRVIDDDGGDDDDGGGDDDDGGDD